MKTSQGLTLIANGQLVNRGWRRALDIGQRWLRHTMMDRAHRRILGLFLILAGWVSPAYHASAAGPSTSEPRKPRVPILKVEQYTLKNGLTVILHEDHKTPLAAINIVYNVGSKDDLPGRTGFAHLFEHMMFSGTQHNDQEFGNLLTGHVVDSNGSTGRDRTVYYEEVTSNALELALWLEAERMGYLLAAITHDKLNVVRNVVKNERRNKYDDVPFGFAEEALLAELYPPGHPYRHRTIGSMADLSAARLADIRAFFERHYVPNNAFLCVAGDFRPAEVKRWIEKYFGPLRRGADSSRSKPDVPRLTGPKHLTLTDEVSHARAQLVWPTVPAGDRDEEPLDILASVLGGLANENRLFRRLIYDQLLAVQVEASHPTYAVSGEFEIDLYAQPGQKLAELVRIADTEIERLKKEGPTDGELRRAQNQREASLLQDLESVNGQASVLCQWAALNGDPLEYRAVIDRVFAVKPADVARVARQYLTDRRIELDVVPGAKAPAERDDQVDRAEPAKGPGPPRDPFADDREEFAAPTMGPSPRFKAPNFKRRTLTNGLSIRIVERHDVPLVTLSLVIRSGETSTPPGKEGLCSLTTNLLDEGTKSRSSLAIAGSLSEIGASISTSGLLESMEINLTTLSPYLDTAMEVYADVILNPGFADQHVQRLKLDRLAALASGARNAENVASEVIQKLIYPREHPYGRPAAGTRQSIESITRDDVVGYYRKTFVPGNAELVVVGDVEPERIVAALEKRLGSWPAGPLPSHPRVNARAPSANQALYLIDLPGATQSVITVGGVGPNGDSEQYNALSMMVTLVSGRINDNIRQEKGYSYSFAEGLQFRKGPGPFTWSGAVQASATKDSLIELMKEIVDVLGPRAASGDEIAQMEASQASTAFSRFETTAGVAYQIWYLIAFNLGDDYYATRIGPRSHVTKDDMAGVAKQYLRPEALTILVVGDRSKIEGQLKDIPFVKSIRRLDEQGNPMPDLATPKSVK
jgi:zinc protease